jgi:hypothetical protein
MGQMRRIGRGSSIAAALAIAVASIAGGLVPRAVAQTPDSSDVVIVLDYSASILKDKANRNRFAAALQRMADRVDETTADLIAGDTTVTLVQFATKAAGYQGCADLKLLGSPSTVAHFADCLRALGAAYRKGLAPALTKRVGVDTNYVAAMEEAAKHLPLDSVRPTVILFTDGKHDVKGVPASRVQPARERLFGARSPFALLPVGMGLAAKDRAALTSGLEALRVIRDMPACVSGATFAWPTVVFDSAADAGNAVAVALQDATCTFTVEPQPSPTPAPTPAAVTNIRATPGDGKVDLAWTPGAVAPENPIVDFAARCRAGEGDWVESAEGVSLEPTATITGLTNGTEYECEVAAVGPSGEGDWTPASSSVTPLSRPPSPSKPTVQALNGGLQVAVAPAPSGVESYRFECSGDNGRTWPATAEVQAPPVSANAAATSIGGLANGVDYVCRAFAANVSGVSDASPLSDAIRPCGSSLECNPLLVPVVGALALVLVLGVLSALFALFRGRTQGYAVAVVDVVHTANLGRGSKLGITFTRDATTRRVTGVVAAKGRRAEIRIQKLRGDRFAVRDKTGRHVANDGEPLIVVDSSGVRHSLVLQAFATNTAAAVASRR